MSTSVCFLHQIFILNIFFCQFTIWIIEKLSKINVVYINLLCCFSSKADILKSQHIFTQTTKPADAIHSDQLVKYGGHSGKARNT